jgi:2-dehydropantoate 2-reductase
VCVMKIGVLGAGAIGTYLGGKLIAAGHDVVLVGRLGDEIKKAGIELTDHAGAQVSIDPSRVRYESDAESLADRETILVAVKSMATEEAARPLASILKRSTTFVSFQNGVSNSERLRTILPKHTVLAGMVPFNVARVGPGRFHNGTSGKLAIERHEGKELPIASALREAGLEVETRGDLPGVKWSKLLINLNNSVNALAGIPLQQQLLERDYRRVMAACVREGLLAARAAGISLARVGLIVPKVVPFVLSLPNALFVRVAGAMVKIDPKARSSMLDDLERGRVTEIDYLNGEVVRLAKAHAVDVPVNQKIILLIREAEAKRAGSPHIAATELLRRVLG